MNLAVSGFGGSRVSGFRGLGWSTFSFPTFFSDCPIQYEKKCWEMDFASRSEAQFLEYLSVGFFGTVYS